MSLQENASLALGKAAKYHMTNGSSKLSYNDADKLFLIGNDKACIKRCLDSIAFSVGIFNPDYKFVVELNLKEKYD